MPPIAETLDILDVIPLSKDFSGHFTISKLWFAFVYSEAAVKSANRSVNSTHEICHHVLAVETRRLGLVLKFCKGIHSRVCRFFVRKETKGVA